MLYPSRTAGLTLLITTLAAPAAAQARATTQTATQLAPTHETPADDHSTAAKFLLYGNTPGSPSTGKLVTVFTLHAITLTALGTGTFLLINRATETDQLNADQARGCATPDHCAAQADRLSALSRQGALATGAFALGGLALLSSVTTAFTWHNDHTALNVTLTPTSAWATVRF